MGFPSGSVVKNPPANAEDERDQALIPGLGRSPGEGIGYPLQYFGAFLVAQTIKNPPAKQQTLDSIFLQEDPLEERAWQQVFLPGESNGQRSLVDYSP